MGRGVRLAASRLMAVGQLTWKAGCIMHLPAILHRLPVGWGIRLTDGLMPTIFQRVLLGY